MNNESEFELDLDLQMLPAWARQPAAANRYSQFEGESEGPRERRRGDRPFRRDRGPEGRGRGPRDQGPRREGPRGGPGWERRGEPRPEESRELEVALPELIVNLVPERKGIEILARQIKLTGRAYPLFQVAALILHKPERFELQFITKKGADGKVLQPLFVCALDDTLWLSEEELAQHALRNHFDTFYQTERVACEAPKGTYTLVAQCGLSGVLLGPPNYHDYQPKLRKLHTDRFSRMPFEAYKAKVKFVRDEAVVKQWLDEQSFKAEYVGLNLPEPVRFINREEAEKHFREVHLPNLVKSVDSFTFPNVESQRFMSRGLRALQRRTVDDQRRFPLKVATVLSQQLANQGLHFFKVNRAVTHVCVARPHFLDLKNTIVSDGVRQIVEFIDAHPHCTRRKLLDALAPSPPSAPKPPAPKPAAPEPGTAPTADGTPVPSAPAGPTPTPEQTAVISDLHWLIHQGHVIEFTDGRMETAKAPKPKPTPPPRPTHKPPTPPVAAAGDSVSAAGAIGEPPGSSTSEELGTVESAAGGLALPESGAEPAPPGESRVTSADQAPLPGAEDDSHDALLDASGAPEEPGLPPSEATPAAPANPAEAPSPEPGQSEEPKAPS